MVAGASEETTARKIGEKKMVVNDPPGSRHFSLGSEVTRGPVQKDTRSSPPRVNTGLRAEPRVRGPV